MNRSDSSLCKSIDRLLTILVNCLWLGIWLLEPWRLQSRLTLLEPSLILLEPSLILLWLVIVPHHLTLRKRLLSRNLLNPISRCTLILTLSLTSISWNITFINILETSTHQQSNGDQPYHTPHNYSGPEWSIILLRRLRNYIISFGNLDHLVLSIKYHIFLFQEGSSQNGTRTTNRVHRQYAFLGWI